MSRLWKNSSYEVARQFCNPLLYAVSSNYGIFISPALARMIHERHWNCANVFSESISGLTQQPFDDVRRFDARQAVVESLESVREPVVVET